MFFPGVVLGILVNVGCTDFLKCILDELLVICGIRGVCKCEDLMSSFLRSRIQPTLCS